MDDPFSGLGQLVANNTPPDAPMPHPAVWRINLIMLSVVVFSAGFGLGKAIFEHWDPFDSDSSDEDEDGEDED